ncbi:MAG: alpha/beta fold hydrolase [Deltaproteobacteria bacterium]|nr:alpha/beta fold hydrolase [Deltaproteobacteria bacterium]
MEKAIGKERYRETRMFRTLLGLLTCTLLMTSACALPVTVKRANPEAVQRRLTGDVLTTGEPSLVSENTLRRNLLTQRFEDAPEQALADLHADAIRDNNPNDLFALAELSFYHAKETDERPYYLAAAVYAFAYIFPDGMGTPPNPIDPRLRVACDLYNRGLTEAFLADDGKEVELRSGVFPLPFGSLTVTFDESQLLWAGSRRLTHFVSASDLEITGLSNRYVRSGIGAPLAASTVLLNPERGVSDFVAPKVKVPANLFLRIERAREDLADGRLHAALELRTDTDADVVRVNGQNLPLEFEPTAAIAYQLSESNIWARELKGFFLGNLLGEKEANLMSISPHRPGRIPVVFVHGTASSAGRWADLGNDLLSDPQIREHFEFWFFTYDTGNPIAYSAARLREALRAAVERFDPEDKDPAMHRMVLIGHSQGGLLVKMMVVDTGTKLWDNVSSVPIEQLKLSEKSRTLIQESLFVEPLPFVRRVIFICTPHRGSYQTGRFLVHWITRFMTFPRDVLNAGTDIFQGNADKIKLATQTRLPTSIDNMTPSNRFIQTLVTIPVAPGVAAHSIIAVQGKGPVEDGSDGVVEYKSAHIDGVESELVVDSGHSAQGNPHTVEEVRRILLLQAAETCEQTGVACMGPAGENGGSTELNTSAQAQ